MDEWLTVAETAALECITEQTVYVRKHRGEYASTRGDGGALLIHHTSLTLAGRNAYALAVRNGALPAIKKTVNLAELNAAEQEKYANRLATVQRIQALPARSDERRTAVIAAAREHGCDRATIYKWLKYVETGEDARLVKRLVDKRGRSIPIIIHTYLEKRYTETGSKQIAIDDAVAYANKLGICIPSETTLKRALMDLDDGEGGAVAMGVRKRDHYNRVSLWTKRDWSKVQPMEVVFADGKRFDILVEDFDGRLIAPWGCFWVDGSTRRLFWPSITDREDSRAIAGSFRLMLKQGGVPLIVYTDNGKTYKAIRLTGGKLIERGEYTMALPKDVQNIFPQLAGLFSVSNRVINAIPYNSRAKPIERVFGLGGVDKVTQALPGWIGPNYKLTPDHTKKMIDAYRKHKRRDDIPPEYRALHIFDFYQILVNWIEQRNRTPHRGEDMEGLTPMEAWSQAEREGWTPTYIRDERMLDVLMMKQQQATLDRNGTITFRGRSYSSIELKRIFARYGKPMNVLIRYDDMHVIEFTRRGKRLRAPKELVVYSLRPASEDPDSFLGLATLDLGVHPLEAAEENQRLKSGIESDTRAVYKSIMTLGSAAQRQMDELLAEHDCRLTHVRQLPDEDRSAPTTALPEALPLQDAPLEYIDVSKLGIYESAGRALRRQDESVAKAKEMSRRAERFDDLDQLG